MLGKLMKYDLKSLFKLLFPLYIAGLLLAVMNGFFLIPAQTKVEMMQYDFWVAILELFHSMSIMIIWLLNFITVIWCVIRTYNSIFAKEGYLTNTLPVTHHQILISKIVSSAIACAATTFVVLSLTLILSIGYLDFDMKLLFYYIELEEIIEIIKLIPLSFAFSAFVCSIVIYLGYALVILVSIALGHLSKYRVIMAFVAFFAIEYVIIQPASTAILFTFMLSPNISFKSLFYGVESLNLLLSALVPIVWAVTTFYAVISVICYLVIAYIVKNKLNLQ
ncbi:MAG: hypothetical protein R3Y09_03395 [Clostridia bacterium]